MGEATNIVERIVARIVDLFSKNERRGNKIKAFLSLVAIFFLVIPIVFHFLALQEIQIQANIISELSSTDTSSVSPELIERYNLLIDKCANERLWINDINSFIKSWLDNLTEGAVSLYQTEISGWFQYVGFGFKPDLFYPILLWNLIPLIIVSVLVIFFVIKNNNDYFGFRKILYLILWGSGFLIVVGIYSVVLAYLLSFLCLIIFIAVEFMVVFIVAISLIITVLIVYKLLTNFLLNSTN